tara:strand:+ start:57278 stop:57775 length:498 start_codon:yes stop_codon:yes gene_type:complete
MNFANCLTLVIALLISTGCAEKNDTVEIVQVSIPYFSGCEETVNRLVNNAKKSAEHNGWLHGAKVVKFDVIPISHAELQGYVEIYMEADAKLLNGTVDEYLLLSANSIVNSCMPNNGFAMTQSELIRYPAKLSYLNHKGAIYPKISDGGMMFYYNDASYDYPGYE